MKTNSFSLPIVIGLLIGSFASGGAAASPQENSSAVPVTIAVTNQSGAPISGAQCSGPCGCHPCPYIGDVPLPIHPLVANMPLSAEPPTQPLPAHKPWWKRIKL